MSNITPSDAALMEHGARHTRILAVYFPVTVGGIGAMLCTTTGVFSSAVANPIAVTVIPVVLTAAATFMGTIILAKKGVKMWQEAGKLHELAQRVLQSTPSEDPEIVLNRV